MKIVLKNIRPVVMATVVSCVLGCGLIVHPAVAFAQTAAVPPAIPPATLPPAPVATSPGVPAQVSSASAVTTPKIIPPPSDAPDASVAAAVTPASDKEEKNGKSLSNAEDKVSDSVKGLAKRLSSTDNVTLDDLNSTKQAIAKIEALIDLEKHLSELDKIRSEREGGSNSRSAMSAVIPASALMTLPSSQRQMPVPAMPASVMQNSSEAPLPSLEVLRIAGGDGHFSAVMKTGEGQTRTVEVGDHIDGGKVTAITVAGVELERNNVKTVLHVKNIQTVFGSSP